MSRAASVERKTRETNISATLELDGSGKYDVQTGNPFLTHMVETWTRYAGFDLTLRAMGDLDHHLVEDVAIVLGQAFKQAFRNGPCVRIAYDFVPMDDALVLCAVDLVDRPFYAGELPIPLWEHFFRSFAMEARINVHLERLRGRDTHHTIEASVKAFARALRRALEPRATEISTKGVVAQPGARPTPVSGKRGKPSKQPSRVGPVSGGARQTPASGKPGKNGKRTSVDSPASRAAPAMASGKPGKNAGFISRISRVSRSPKRSLGTKS